MHSFSEAPHRSSNGPAMQAPMETEMVIEQDVDVGAAVAVADAGKRKRISEIGSDDGGALKAPKLEVKPPSQNSPRIRPSIPSIFLT